MNGKIRVSIVATALHGSETKPYLNLVNNTFRNTSPINKSVDHKDNLFSNNNHIDKNIINSIDGATALKLDESYEIKSSEEQNTLINDFESNEENKIFEDEIVQKNLSDEIPTGVSIESASYIEKNNNNKTVETVSHRSDTFKDEIEDEHAPKLFSEEYNSDNSEQKDLSENQHTNNDLFDQDSNDDEDFEIPAFLRRQKF